MSGNSGKGEPERHARPDRPQGLTNSVEVRDAIQRNRQHELAPKDAPQKFQQGPNLRRLSRHRNGVSRQLGLRLDSAPSSRILANARNGSGVPPHR